jgi:hypothetical protein
MNANGRPRVLDDLKRRDICTLINAGCGLQEAARYVGCHVSTIRREMADNPEFKKKLRGSELGAELEALRAMRKASATHWRAAAWMLERTNPRRFGRIRLKSFQAEDMYAVINEVVESAVDEIQDRDTRHRVCRKLLAAAHNATRALGVEDPTRCDPKAVTNPARADEQGLDELLESVERDHRRAVRGLRRNTQNPSTFAPRQS